MRPPVRGGRGGSGRGGPRSPGFAARGRGRGGQFRDEGPPATVVEVGTFMHACEGEIVCKLTSPKIPYFNGQIYLENKTQIGKVEEIFGAVSEVMFTIKLLDGIDAKSYSKGSTFHINPDKLLPIERFTAPSSAQSKNARGGGRGRGGPARGRGRGGRGARSGRGRY
mmetsp:Transcript_7661/g.28049  ORF Transcript_7661/g.28049 Transcript_7661/m.28049 type:complete len:167 (+) Transcript_7661:121-621(+)